MEFTVKKIISLLAAVILLICAFVVPAGAVFNKEMLSILFLVAMAIVLWVIQPLPIGSTSFLVMVLMPLLGIVPYKDAFLGFSNPANFFTIASFGLALGISKTSIPKHLLGVLIKFCKNDTKKITLTFMLLTYVISTVISDITAVVISLEFVMGLLDMIEDETEKKRVGKQFLIGVPIASLLGGTATPVGSTVNVLALDLLRAHNGAEVAFVDWMVLGVPVSFVTLFIAWFLIVRIFKAQNIDESVIELYKEKTKNTQSKIKNEGVVIFILALTLVLWILSSWIPAFNTTTVALLSLIALMFPKIEAFTWKEFSSSVSWELPIMGAATISLSGAVLRSGIVDIIISSIEGYLPYGNSFVMVAIVALIVTLVLFFIPVGPASVSMLTIPCFILGEVIGVNPILLVITVATFASNSSIIPLNAVMYIPYSKGYWKINEVAKVGIIMSIFWILISAVWMPFAMNLIN